LTPSGESLMCWEPPPTRVCLGRGEVHVWRAALSAEGSRGAGQMGSLSEQERLGARGFHFAKDRDRYVLSRSILRQLLGLYLGRRPAAVDISVGPFGKPFVPEDSAGSGLRFNLSHSGDFALYAFSVGRDVGIDLERSVPLELDELDSAGFLSEREKLELSSLGGRSRQEALLRCWARKEAYIKATGEGMNAPLTEIEVSVAPGSPSVHRRQRGREADRRWSLEDLCVAPGYAACLAVEGEAAIDTWEWLWPEPESPPRAAVLWTGGRCAAPDVKWSGW